MAQIPPSTANPVTSATNGQPTPSSSNPQQAAPISWEGDRMFNVYIHDYFRKRGFYKAAKELVAEADIGNDAAPPINARQGFLFEWWSVFWMFFSAKTTGQGPENVMLYFHWIQNQQAERNRLLQHENEQRRQLPLTTQPPTQRPMVRPPLNGVRQPSMVNGAVPIPPPSGQLSPAGQQMQYPMSGVPHPPMPPTHQQPPPGPGQPPSQLNGIVDPSTPHAINHPQRPPSQQQVRPAQHGPLTQPPQPGHPPPSHPNSVPHLQASQRQASRGQHDSMRPGQFHSPTMPSAPPPGPGQGQLAAHLSGMHPPQFQHLGRGPPPQGGQPNHASPRNPSQTPTQPYQQLANHGGPMPPQQGGSGSRSATPGGHTLTQPSPALAARDPPPPQGQGHAINEEMSRRFQQQQQQQPQQQSQQQPPQPPRGGGQMQEQQELMSMETSMSRIPPVFLAQMKMEAGVGDRDIMTLSYEEKARLNSVFKKTMENYNGTTAPMSAGRNGRPPAPNQPPPMSGMPMYPQHAPPGARLPPSVVPVPAPGPRGQKRGSTSPTDEQAGGDSTPKDQSPPDKKRLRPSPQNPTANTPGGADAPVVAPPMGSMAGFPPNHPASHPGGYPGPQPQQGMPPMSAMRHHGPVGGMPPGQGVPPGGMSMNLGAGPGISGHQMPPGMPHMNLTGNPQIMGHPLSNPNAPQVGPSSDSLFMQSPEISFPFQTQGAQTAAQQQQQQQQMHYRQAMATQAAQHMVKMPPGMAPPNAPNPNASSSAAEARGGAAGPAGGPSGPGPASRQAQQGKPGSMMPPPPSPAHRAENNNSGQKGPVGMMPPPAQPVSAPPSGGGLPPKEQTTPPAGTTGSSPSLRPASTSGAAAPSGSQQSGASAPMSQGSTGGPATPAPGAAGGNGGSTGNNTTAPSPSAILTNRISPSAAMNSLPRPQTSGPEANTTANAAGQNAPPPPPPSAPPSSGPSASIGNNIFTDFFESMDDQFGLDTAFGDVDTTEFAQWIDMNPLS